MTTDGDAALAILRSLVTDRHTYVSEAIRAPISPPG